MNEEDYKAIANIIARNKDECPADSDQEFDAFDYVEYEDLVRDLAEYFEDRLHVNFIAYDYNRFEKKQFIKDCGVEE